MSLLDCALDGKCDSRFAPGAGMKVWPYELVVVEVVLGGATSTICPGAAGAPAGVLCAADSLASPSWAEATGEIPAIARLKPHAGSCRATQNTEAIHLAERMAEK